MENLFNCFSEGLEKLDNRPLYDWLKDNITLPVAYGAPGRFTADISPWIKRPMRDLLNESIRQFNFACGTQTFKSGINEVLMPYLILQQPGPTLRVHQNDPAAAKCMQTRIVPMLKSNPKINSLMENATYDKKNGLLILDNGMYIKCCGPSKNNLQSDSIKYLILEECHLYNPNEEIIKEAKARTDYFINSRKIIIASQPDMEGSDFHKEFIRGNVYEYGFRCPSCNTLQLYDFYKNLNWTKNNEEGTLSDDERTNNTWLTCPHCKHEIKDNPHIRTNLIAGGDYVQTHKGDPTIVSYTWGHFVNKDKTFKSIAMDYLNAKREYARTQIDNELKIFRNKILGKFWDTSELYDTPELIKDIPASSQEWPDETHRFLTIDVQQDCMYWMIMAWSNKVAESHLVDWGVCAGFDQLLEIKLKYNVKPMHISIDSGYEAKPIYKESVIRGELYPVTIQGRTQKVFFPWLCVKGDGGKFSPRVDYDHGDGVKKYYSRETRPDCFWEANSKFKGFRAKLILFSNYSIKSIIFGVRDNKIPFKFKYNNRADETFRNHLYSEQLNFKSGRYELIEGKENHLLDCLCQQVVLALISKCYIPSAEKIIKN